MNISLIAAVSENNVIGSENDLPWKLPKDMKYFMDTTMGYHVLMGRKTYESFPAKYRPLPGRTNIVISRTKQYDNEEVQVFDEVEKGIEFARENGVGELFIIGGGSIYDLTINQANRLYITRVHAEVEGDTYFPELNLEQWSLVKDEKHHADEKHDHDYSFRVYVRK
ncbi:MAG: dihydrofolate reductase [Chitinophagales bacterium]|nr:dihydrofolate reductase [Chitinophagales bacterium]